MSRMGLNAVGVAIALMIGCSSSPTEMCACPPSRSAVVVEGTLRDAADAPVANTQLFLDGVPANFPQEALATLWGTRATTDASGAFRVLVYSMYGPAPMTLRAVVVRTSPADTIRLAGGQVPFRHEREVPETVQVTLRLP
ncbi:MAG: hypothetical protein V4617_17045 [Gemmatimonadota bacterium]